MCLSFILIFFCLVLFNHFTCSAMYCLQAKFLSLAWEKLSCKSFDVLISGGLLSGNLGMKMCPCYKENMPWRGGSITSTHNLCFGAKIRKISIPLYSPVLLYRSGVQGVYMSHTCFSDVFSTWVNRYSHLSHTLFYIYNVYILLLMFSRVCRGSLDVCMPFHTIDIGSCF